MNRQDELLEYEREQKLRQKKEQLKKDQYTFNRQKELGTYTERFANTGVDRGAGPFYKILSAFLFLAFVGIGAFSFFSYQRSSGEIEYLENQIKNITSEKDELLERLKIENSKDSYETYKSKKMLSDAEKQRVIYEESFEDRKKGWIIRNDNSVELSIGREGYYFSHKSNTDSWMTWNKSPLSGNENYLIECYLKKEEGVDNYGYGVTWGLKDTRNNLNFKISGNGYYIFSKVVDGKRKEIIPWKKTAHINRFDNKNKISIKKYNDKLHFFINDKWVDTVQNQSFQGKNIGFAVDNRQSITISRLIITKLIKRQFLLSENFEDNRNNWAQKESIDVELKVDNGGYIFSHNRPDKSWLSWKSVDIGSNENFLIESEMEKLSGINNNGYGIVFGLRDSGNCFFFQISGDGHYRFYKSTNGKYTQIIPWKRTRLVNMFNSINKLSIKRSGSDLNFYINDTFVDKTPFPEFMGRNVGFRIDMKQKVKFRNLWVSRI